MKQALYTILTVCSLVFLFRPPLAHAVPSCPVKSCPSCPSNGCSGSAPGPNCRCTAQRSCRCTSWCFGYVGGRCEAYDSTCSNYQWECSAPTTPRPTSPPRPTPTRGVCNCHAMNVSGVASPGETLNFTASANVVSPHTANTSIPSMSFIVLQNGTQIAQSGPVAAGRPVRTIDPGTGETVDRYSATYSYTIPQSGTGTVSYTVLMSYACQRSAGLRSSDPRVAGYTVEMEPPVWTTPLSPKGFDSLKLGTWRAKTSASIKNMCDRVEFQIPYL